MQNIDSHLREAILESTLKLSGEITSLCADLVRVPSVNGRDKEAGVVAVLAKYASAYDLPIDIIEAAPGRPTILVGPSAPSDAFAEGGLLLVGHTDTVPEGDISAWRYDPFGAEIVGSRLFGRGASDNKAGIAAAFFAIVALHRMGLLEAANPGLIAVPDEEAGATGTIGIVPLLKSHRLKAAGAIYTYPGMGKIHIGHRGVLRLTVAAHGQSVHSGSRAWQQGTRGANATVALADLLLQLEHLDINSRIEPQHGYWASLRGVITPGTTIAGGAGISIVPGFCEATIDVRTVPGHTVPDLLKRINAVVKEVAHCRPGVKFSLRVDSSAPPTVIPDNASVVRALQFASESLLSNQPPLEIAGPANEGYLLNEAGIPTICGFGPTGNRFHAPNEYVELPSLHIAAAVYALTAVHLQHMTNR